MASGPADVNDDGAIDVSDAVAFLNAIYLGSEPIPLPFGVCGIDRTTDALSCENTGCEVVLYHRFFDPH